MNRGAGIAPLPCLRFDSYRYRHRWLRKANNISPISPNLTPTFHCPRLGTSNDIPTSDVKVFQTHLKSVEFWSKFSARDDGNLATICMAQELGAAAQNLPRPPRPIMCGSKLSRSASIIERWRHCLLVVL